MRQQPRVPLAQTARRVQRVGARHFVHGADLGQTGNPTPAGGPQPVVAGLQAEGLSGRQISMMGRGVPGALLMG